MLGRVPTLGQPFLGELCEWVLRFDMDYILVNHHSHLLCCSVEGDLRDIGPLSLSLPACSPTGPPDHQTTRSPEPPLSFANLSQRGQQNVVVAPSGLCCRLKQAHALPFLSLCASQHAVSSTSSLSYFVQGIHRDSIT